MKLYPSYVIEAQMRHRRRVACGVGGVVLLSLAGAVTLVLLEAEPALAAGALSPGCADVRSPAPACDRASLRPEG